MRSVFVLQHVRTTEADNEDIKFIGVYSSRQNAQNAAIRLTGVAGFSADPDGFSVDEYRIDEDHWVEGYVTVGDD